MAPTPMPIPFPSPSALLTATEIQILPRGSCRYSNRGCGNIPPEKRPLLIVVGIIVFFIVISCAFCSCRGPRPTTNKTPSGAEAEAGAEAGTGASGAIGPETGAGLAAGTGTGAGTISETWNQPVPFGTTGRVPTGPPPVYEERPSVPVPVPPPTYQRVSGEVLPSPVPLGMPPVGREMAPRYA